MPHRNCTPDSCVAPETARVLIPCSLASFARAQGVDVASFAENLLSELERIYLPLDSLAPARPRAPRPLLRLVE